MRWFLKRLAADVRYAVDKPLSWRGIALTLGLLLLLGIIGVSWRTNSLAAKCGTDEYLVLTEQSQRICVAGRRIE